MLAAVARRFVPILVVALALLVPPGASAFPALSPLLRAVRPTPLAGKVVGIDPGHNGGNFSDPSFINSPVWNGREEEACDTTGTETDGGYTEALFNFRVASYLRRDLVAKGAKVVILVVSRPASGSVTPKQTCRSPFTIRGRSRVFISSEPCTITGCIPKMLR